MTNLPCLALAVALSAAPTAPTASEDAARLPLYDAARGATITDAPEGSLERAVAQLYRTLSGPKGARRDRQALEALLHPDVRFMFAEKGADGGTVLRTLGRDAFLAYTTPLWESGFFESEVAHQAVRYGRVAHVWSTYETRRTEGGPVVGRGINSLQLFFDGERWRVVTVYWQGERQGLPIPSHFLAAP